jgi:hypothetical protein
MSGDPEVIVIRIISKACGTSVNPKDQLLFIALSLQPVSRE